MSEVKKVVTVKVEPVTEPLVSSPTVSKVESPVLAMLYVMYKLNMIGNYGVKQALEIIGKPFPDDIAAYLVKEAAKV